MTPPTNGSSPGGGVAHARIVWLTILPVASVATYVGLYNVSPELFHRWVQGELGIVELATAALFAVAGYLAVDIAVHAPVRGLYRRLYLMFGMAMGMVMLEEISYGQHLVGWATPEVFAKYNQQGETNLHNLFHNQPTKRLNQCAEIGSLVGFVLLPALVFAGERRTRKDGLSAMSWRAAADHLVPGFELVPLVGLAWLVAGLKRFPGIAPDLNELREMLWAWSACGFALVMQSRLRRPRAK